MVTATVMAVIVSPEPALASIFPSGRSGQMWPWALCTVGREAGIGAELSP